MREALNRATEVSMQNALLLSHQAHLQNLDRAVQASHAAITSQLETSVVQKSTMPSSISSAIPSASKKIYLRTKTKRQSSRTHRLALPRWLSSCVWEFAVQEYESGGWDFQLHPVYLRQYGSLAFDVVRSGNVEVVKKLLATGELSVSDQELDRFGVMNKSPLTVSRGCSSHSSLY
jgi:hypothetical protein